MGQLWHLATTLIDEDDRVVVHERVLEERRVGIESVHLPSGEGGILFLAVQDHHRRVLVHVESLRSKESSKAGWRMRGDADFETPEPFESGLDREIGRDLPIRENGAPDDELDWIV